MNLIEKKHCNKMNREYTQAGAIDDLRGTTATKAVMSESIISSYSSLFWTKLYVCMYVCMYVCTCMYTYVCVCMYVRMYVCTMYVCMDLCTYVCTFVSMYVYRVDDK